MNVHDITFEILSYSILYLHLNSRVIALIIYYEKLKKHKKILMCFNISHNASDDWNEILLNKKNDKQKIVHQNMNNYN